MNRLHIPNEFVEWIFIILGVTIAALAGAGLKSWLDNVLETSAVSSWVPGVSALALFFVLVAPFYYWAGRSARYRGEPTAAPEPDLDDED